MGAAAPGVGTVVGEGVGSADGVGVGVGTTVALGCAEGVVDGVAVGVSVGVLVGVAAGVVGVRVFAGCPPDPPTVPSVVPLLCEPPTTVASGFPTIASTAVRAPRVTASTAAAATATLPQGRARRAGSGSGSGSGAFGSTTGGMWVSEDQGDRWAMLRERLPPVHAVCFA